MLEVPLGVRIRGRQRARASRRGEKSVSQDPSLLYPFELEERQGYDLEAQRYDASRFDCATGQLYHRREIESLLTSAAMHPGFRVLDLAAGTGGMAIPLTHRVQSVVALDLSHEMLATGRKRALEERATQIQFVQANGRHLPFPDRHFDLGMAFRSPLPSSPRPASPSPVKKACRDHGRGVND